MHGLDTYTVHIAFLEAARDTRNSVNSAFQQIEKQTARRTE